MMIHGPQPPSTVLYARAALDITQLSSQRIIQLPAETLDQAEVVIISTTVNLGELSREKITNLMSGRQDNDKTTTRTN